MATVLSPCLVDGETVLVEVDLEACPKSTTTYSCTAAVWYANKDTIQSFLRCPGMRIPDNRRISW